MLRVVVQRVKNGCRGEGWQPSPGGAAPLGSGSRRWGWRRGEVGVPLRPRAGKPSLSRRPSASVARPFRGFSMQPRASSTDGRKPRGAGLRRSLLFYSSVGFSSPARPEAASLAAASAGSAPWREKVNRAAPPQAGKPPGTRKGWG